jgi:hypothetical protein
MLGASFNISLSLNMWDVIVKRWTFQPQVGVQVWPHLKSLCFSCCICLLVSIPNQQDFSESPSSFKTALVLPMVKVWLSYGWSCWETFLGCTHIETRSGFCGVFILDFWCSVELNVPQAFGCCFFMVFPKFFTSRISQLNYGTKHR